MNSTVRVLVKDPDPDPIAVVVVVEEVGVVRDEVCSIAHCNAIPILSSIKTAVMPPWRMCGCPFIPVPRAKRMFILSKAEDSKDSEFEAEDPEAAEEAETAEPEEPEEAEEEVSGTE
jgi:hypothetical protein